MDIARLLYLGPSSSISTQHQQEFGLTLLDAEVRGLHGSLASIR